MGKIRFAALDGSFTHFGIAKMIYDTNTKLLAVEDLKLIKSEKSKNKTVRVSSDRLARATFIRTEVCNYIQDCPVVFAEIPTGAQSASAAFAFGIVLGIYASLPVPVIEVAPSETKMAAVGTKTASKQEMIEWATSKFPDAPWLLTKRQGIMVPINDNEHLADAVAIAHAGVNTPVFKQMSSMLGILGVAA